MTEKGDKNKPVGSARTVREADTWVVRLEGDRTRRSGKSETVEKQARVEVSRLEGARPARSRKEVEERFNEVLPLETGVFCVKPRLLGERDSRHQQ